MPQKKIENNLKAFNVFLEALYHPEVASAEFKAARNRFAELFPEFSSQEKTWPALDCNDCLNAGDLECQVCCRYSHYRHKEALR